MDSTSTVPKALIILSCVAILLGLGGIGYLVWSSSKSQGLATPTEAPKTTLAANLALMEGQVSWQEPGQERYVEAKLGDTIREKYRVKTGVASKVVIAFDTGDTVRLAESTTVEIVTINAKQVVVNDLSGRVYSRVEHSDTKVYTVQAGSYKNVAIGTAFETSYDGTNVTTVVTDGSVKVGAATEQVVVTGKKATAAMAEPDKIALADANTAELSSEFMTWNKDQDSKNGQKVVTVPSPKVKEEKTAVKTEAKVETKQETKSAKSEATSKIETKVETKTEESSQSDTSQVKSISLSVNLENNVIKASWQTSGSATQGYKLVWSTNPNPTYPTRDGDSYIYLSDPASGSQKITDVENGKTYYIRVCEYLGGSCGTYSNEISLSVQ